MILADTSVWVDHFRSVNRPGGRSANNEMGKQLSDGNIVIHPLVTAELALGSLRDRAKTLALLDMLPQVRVAQLSELRLTIEARQLFNRGIGLIDASLIASIFLNPPTLLWTRDKQLRRVAEGLSIHAGLA